MFKRRNVYRFSFSSFLKERLKPIPIRKLKRRVKLITILLMVFIFLAYFVHKTSFQYLLYKIFGFKSYDLMSDALFQQNVKNIKFDCDQAGEEQMVKSKYHLYKRFYNLSHLTSEFRSFDLIYENSYNLESEPRIFTNLAKDLKLCSHGDYRIRFKSVSVENQLLGSMILRKKDLSSSEFKLIRSSSNLKPGGFYQSPLCLQDFFHHFSNSTGLNLVENMVKNFDQIYSKPRELLESIAKSTYPIIKELASNDEKLREFVAKKSTVTAIIIPYLNRKQNLVDFLFNIHSFLQKKFINYLVLVAEQFNSQDAFNKGQLYNFAYKYLKKKFNSTRMQIGCIILHDVDLIPESDLNVYECDWKGDSPRHLSVAIRKSDSDSRDYPNEDPQKYLETKSSQYKTYYDFLIGGVLCMKPSTYETINGFSNEYFNWGGEDDDIAMRINAKSICVKKPPPIYSAYKMLKHQKSKSNPLRENMLFSSVKRMKRDGLSNIEELSSFVDRVEYGLYTKLLINVGKKSFWSQVKYFYKNI